jgi:hypothetical protein
MDGGHISKITCNFDHWNIVIIPILTLDPVDLSVRQHVIPEAIGPQQVSDFPTETVMVVNGPIVLTMFRVELPDIFLFQVS